MPNAMSIVTNGQFIGVDMERGTNVFDFNGSTYEIIEEFSEGMGCTYIAQRWNGDKDNGLVMSW